MRVPRLRAARLAQRAPLLSATIVSLGVLLGTHTPVRAMDADERPDLTIELVDIPVPSGQREVHFRITNQSVWWADETTAHVETVAPTAGNPADLFVENLDPGQSTLVSYTLAAGCDGQVVRAEVAAAGNYAGVKEANLTNNRVQGAACEPSQPIHTAPAPAPAGPIHKALPKASPPSGFAPLPKGTTLGDLQARTAKTFVPPPKVQTVVLTPSATQLAFRCHYDICSPPGGLWVGYDQLPRHDNVVDWVLSGGEDDSWSVAQTAVTFDLAFLTRVPGTKVRQAVLRFDESRGGWSDGAGNQLSRGDCVEVLGRATEPWAGLYGRGGNGLPQRIANEKVQAHTPGAREWWIGSEIRDQWLDQVVPALGFVLRGGNESVQGHDYRSCLSQISNITLELTYETPSGG